MVFYVYILRNPDGHTYIGQTNNLERRLSEHNDPEYRGTQYTKRYKLPWTLVHFEEFKTRGEAMIRERELKTGKGRDWIKKNFKDSGC